MVSDLHSSTKESSREPWRERESGIAMAEVAIPKHKCKTT